MYSVKTPDARCPGVEIGPGDQLVGAE